MNNYFLATKRFQTDHWCVERREDLILLAEEKSPLVVYNEEILNEALFDLLSIEGVEKIFQSVNVANQRQVLRKVYEMGGGFRVGNAAEINYLRGLFPTMEACRFLFASSANKPEDYKHAPASGMQVVVPMDGMKPMINDYGGSRFLCRLPSKMQASVRLSPEGWPSATPAGFFIEEEEGDLFCLLEMLHRLQDAASLDSLPRIVCLGNGALLPIIREKDKIDTEVMSGQMEEIMDAYPNLRLWLEPGRHLVSHACILLSRAEHVNTQTVAQDRLGGPLHGFYNLSRPEERVQRNHCGEHKKGLVGILSGAEAEDILAVTNMGGCRLQMIGSHAPVEEHYLKARRICRVKL